MRIAFCVDTFDIGGTELNAVRLAEHLVRRGIEVEVVAMKHTGPLRARYEAAGIPVSTYSFRSLASIAAIRECLRLRRHLRRGHVDVLHCHDYYSNVFGALAVLGRGGPVLITSRRWSTKHAPRVLQHLNGWVARRADRVVANSTRLKGELVRDDRVAPERIVMISNFVEAHSLAPLDPARRSWWRERFGIPAGAVAVGCVSRLAPVKNFGALVAGLAALRASWPDLHVLLIGDGTCRGELERQARQLGLVDRVHIAGLQTSEGENLQGILDIVVLPSISEGFPNAVVEAMAARVPVIATDVGGVPDVVADRVTGLLIPAQDANALAGAIDLLLRDGSLRQALADAGHERVIARHTADQIVGETQALYSSLLTRSREKPFTDAWRGHLHA